MKIKRKLFIRLLCVYVFSLCWIFLFFRTHLGKFIYILYIILFSGEFNNFSKLAVDKLAFAQSNEQKQFDSNKAYITKLYIIQLLYIFLIESYIYFLLLYPQSHKFLSFPPPSHSHSVLTSSFFFLYFVGKLI